MWPLARFPTGVHWRSFAIARGRPTWAPPEPLVVQSLGCNLQIKQAASCWCLLFHGADNHVGNCGRPLIDHLQSVCPSRPARGISASLCRPQSEASISADVSSSSEPGNSFRRSLAVSHMLLSWLRAYSWDKRGGNVLRV